MQGARQGAMWDDEEVGSVPGVEAGVEAGVDPGVEAGVDPDAGADEAEAGGGNGAGHGAGMAGPAGRFVEDNGEVDGDGDQGGEQDVDGDGDSEGEGEGGPGVASSRGSADGRAEGDDVMQLLPEGLVERDEHLEQLGALVALKSVATVATVADCLGEERETVAHLLDRTLVMDRSMRALVEREVARATDDGLGFELEQFVEAGEVVPDAPIVLDLQGSFQAAEEAELAAA